MTDVMIDGKTAEMPDPRDVVRLDDLDEQLIERLVDRGEGLRLTGQDGAS